MRVYELIIAVTAATVATSAAAQDLGGIARHAAGTAVGDTAGQANRSAASRGSAPAGAVTPGNAAAPALPVGEPSEGGIVVAEDMPVMSSDGVRVAVVKHTTTGGTTYAPDKTFFTADPYYRLRRIYGREATVSGGAVRLKMTAAQYRARNQNPD